MDLAGTQLLALGLAALAAVGYGTASVLQAVGAGRTAGTLHTLADPVYLSGLVLDLLAWLASLVALRSMPVYQVQSILAGSIAVTVLLARFWLAHRLRRIDVAAIGATILALAVLAACAGPQAPTHLGTTSRLWLALAALAVAALGLAAVAADRPGLSGALAGLAFGGAALCARALTVPADAGGHPAHSLAVILADPLSWGLAGYGITGMLLYAQALEHGKVGPVTALLWSTEVVLPSIAGAVLLGDSVRSGRLPVAVLAVLVAVGAAAVLAQST